MTYDTIFSKIQIFKNGELKNYLPHLDSYKYHLYNLFLKCENLDKLFVHFLKTKSLPEYKKIH